MADDGSRYIEWTDRSCAYPSKVTLAVRPGANRSEALATAWDVAQQSGATVRLRFNSWEVTMKVVNKKDSTK